MSIIERQIKQGGHARNGVEKEKKTQIRMDCEQVRVGFDSMTLTYGERHVMRLGYGK